MWTPFPTPPLSDAENDVYFDDCLDLLYDRDFMPEDKLPVEIHELQSSLDKPVSPVKKNRKWLVDDFSLRSCCSQ